jgi:uncharacterized DUF497 family protein
MQFCWDEKKNRTNLRKHRISFEAASLVFEDSHAVSVLDSIVGDEQRWLTLGSAGGILVLMVVHTWYERAGEEVTRIISARKATPQERIRYEEAH